MESRHILEAAFMRQGLVLVVAITPLVNLATQVAMAIGVAATTLAARVIIHPLLGAASVFAWEAGDMATAAALRRSF